jgi:DNA repair photolyase
MSAGLDFETKILVKENAPTLLRKELCSPKWTPKVVGLGTVTDVYQPVEKRYGITRELLKVFLEFRNPVFIITKNFLVTRDIDLLSELARHRAAAVYVSVTTLDNDLARVMEPRTSLPAMRLRAIETLARAGIPVGVSLAPVIPGLTDHEMPAILERTSKAGARHAWYAPVRLPHGVADLFQDWLSKHYAGRKEKILNRIRQIREGCLNDSRFHTRMEGKGIFADQLAALFHVYCKKYSLNLESWDLSTASFRRSAAADLFS